jgi:rubrerythrin
MEDITLVEIIDYARINEDNAKRFYLGAAEHARNESVKAFLLSLAEEEQAYRPFDGLDKIIEAGKPLLNRMVPSNLSYEDTRKSRWTTGLSGGPKAAIGKRAMDSYLKICNLVDDRRRRTSLLAGRGKHLRDFEEKYDDFAKEIENCSLFTTNNRQGEINV